MPIWPLEQDTLRSIPPPPPPQPGHPFSRNCVDRTAARVQRPLKPSKRRTGNQHALPDGGGGGGGNHRRRHRHLLYSYQKSDRRGNLRVCHHRFYSHTVPIRKGSHIFRCRVFWIPRRHPQRNVLSAVSSFRFPVAGTQEVWRLTSTPRFRQAGHPVTVGPPGFHADENPAPTGPRVQDPDGISDLTCLYATSAFFGKQVQSSAKNLPNICKSHCSLLDSLR